MSTEYFAIQVANQIIPCEGPKAVRFNFDFQTANQYEADFTISSSMAEVSDIQSIYVNTVDLVDNLDILCSGTGQRLTVPPGRCGYIPLLLGNPQVITFSSQPALGSKCQVIALNVPMPSYLWEIN